MHNAMLSIIEGEVNDDTKSVNFCVVSTLKKKKTIGEKEGTETIHWSKSLKKTVVEKRKNTFCGDVIVMF